MVDKQLIQKFKYFQEKTRKYPDFDLEEIELEGRKIYSNSTKELICKKRMGFTPIRTVDGDVNWFTVSDLTKNSNLYIDKPNTKEKTSLELLTKKFSENSDKLIPIKKGDVLVSFKLTVGLVKIYNSDLPAYCNEAIDILTPFEGVDSRYLAYCCMMEYPKYGERTNNGVTLNDEHKRLITIPIPKPQNKTYTSLKIQEILVDFIEYYQAATSEKIHIVQQISNKITDSEAILLPSFFKADPSVQNRFDAFCEEKKLDLCFMGLFFNEKRIHSNIKTDLVCRKRMGFTPDVVADGTINWFSVSDMTKTQGFYIDRPNTKKKTTLDLIKQKVSENSDKYEPIKRGDVLVSFKLTVGVVKIYDSDLPAYCNEAIDILTPNKGIDSAYLAYNCVVEYPKYGERTNNGFTLNDEHKKQISILIPKSTDAYTSLELQQIIVEFMELCFKKMEEKRKIADKLQNLYNKHTQLLIQKTFKNEA